MIDPSVLPAQAPIEPKEKKGLSKKINESQILKIAKKNISEKAFDADLFSHLTTLKKNCLELMYSNIRLLT